MYWKALVAKIELVESMERRTEMAGSGDPSDHKNCQNSVDGYVENTMQFMYEEEDDEVCASCGNSLMVPFVECAECLNPRINLCLHCFAKGVSMGQHQSDHRYTVVKNDFSLLEPGWTCEEEMNLLRAIADCGIGNWSDVSHQVRTKSKTQCQNHYMYYYLENPKPPLIKYDPPDITFYPNPVYYRSCEEPLRPSEGSTLQTEMAGYMPARGDFTIEYDNYAETDIKDLHFEGEDEEQYEIDLKLTVLDIYRSRLKERTRRKKIIRDYGLIDARKLQMTNRWNEKFLGLWNDCLRTCCRLVTPEAWNKYTAALNYERELRVEITKLQQYRQAGITHLGATDIYEKLLARREENKPRRQLLSDLLNHMQDESACQQWLQKHATLETSTKGYTMPLPTAPRKTAPPLDIKSLPGHEKLSEREQELCSRVRLVPESYLEFRKLLVTENNKNGYLRLAQARNMIKIDVNKTRKIYDFLIEEGLITKDS